MATLTYVVGRSGSGKSTSICPIQQAGIQGLNPEETIIINTDQKPLPAPEFTKLYSKEKNNYYKSNDTLEVIEQILKPAHKRENIKSIVIDTWSRLQTDTVMSSRFRKRSGFDKWAEFAGAQYDLLNIINDKLRDDIIVYLFAHPETTFDDNGSPQERIAVQGQQLKKFVPESFSSIVLYAEPSKMTGQGLKFGFRTVNSGADTCKSPIGLFKDEFIPNDLGYVDTAIRNYYNL
tara:strand:+ start:3623 stop:4324 length:702 start_codon:yes stop_codon:yes gene_type:complete